MPYQIQAGTMIVFQSANLQPLALNSEPYFRNWRSLGIAESLGLDRLVRAKGLNFFFLVGEIRAFVPAWGGHNTLRRGVKRLLAQIQLLHFNCLEVTDVRRKYFLGVPYLSISANPRHIQQGCQIQSIAQRSRNGGAETRAAN